MAYRHRRSWNAATPRAVALAIGACGLAACGAEPSGAEMQPPPKVGAELCAGEPQLPPSSTQLFSALSARVVDETGNPAAVVTRQVCGFDLCVPGDLDETTGAVSVRLDVPTPISGPAFKYGYGLEYAQFVVPLPDEPMLDLSTVATVRFPGLKGSASLRSGAAAASGDVTLTLPGAARITYEAISFGPEERGFRAVRVPPNLPLPAVDIALGLELLVAMTPVATELCPPAELSLDNSPAWPPGAALEFFVHGVQLSQRWAPYGGWRKVSGGAVSSDGKRLVTAAGEGIPVLSVIGIRRAR